MSDQDIGDAEFEDRIRALLGGGAARPVSASDVIEGAKRRRSRRRATVAGSSLATLAVVGVAAGAVVVGGGAGSGGAAGTTATGSRTSSGSASPTSPASAPGAVATSSPTASSTGPKTCSASVTGTVPPPDASTDEQGLRWDTFSGTTAGNPWSIQLHVFPDAASYGRFANKVPGTVPTQALTSLHSGADVVFRTPGQDGWGMLGMPDGAKPSDFATLSGTVLGKGAGFLFHGWITSPVDHMCLQYADRAEFVPVLKAQAGTFAIFGVVKQDQPQALIGYDAQGHEVGQSKAFEIERGALVFVPQN